MNTSNLVWPTINFQTDKVCPFGSFIGDFSTKECKKIIEIGNELSLQPGFVDGNKAKTDIRDSNICWLEPNQKTFWIYQKIQDIIIGANKQYFGFDLYGMIEPFQFTKYSAPGGKYIKHQDTGVNGLVRKLSMTIQLSDPNDYEGGDLLIYCGESPIALDKRQGAINIFPSFMLHEVKAVTKGTRYSLVGWFTGPSFK